MQTLRILIVDDHSIICECLKTLLNSQADMKVAGAASRGEYACILAGELNPDLIVMDVAMPGLGGAAATKRIKELYPQIKILAFSAYEDTAYVRQLMKAGTSGYVLKGASINVIANAIRVVVDGGTYLDPKIASRLTESPHSVKAGRSDSFLVDPLSEREASVLRLTAHGLTNKEMASIIGVGVKTIESYKTRLYRKLDLRSRSDLVRYALTRGWLQDEMLSS